jgi:hypothetical protein
VEVRSGHFLSRTNCRTAPLKPKAGLNGPPARINRALRGVMWEEERKTWK